jgi:phage host-nuclease inhibitor protein Gam
LPDTFHVSDDASANWVVKKIVEARTYAERCQEWCRREQVRARREEEFFLFRFGAQLASFARKKLAEQGGRRKSVFLPAGQIGFRSEPAKLMVDDEALVLEWAKREMPTIVQMIERVPKSDLNDLLKSTGEMPDAGAHIEPAAERFFIK